MAAVTLLIENIALIVLIICGMWNTRQITKLRDRVRWLESPTHDIPAEIDRRKYRNV